VRAEIVQEYLWRMLVDWPPLVGEAARPRLLGEARRALGDALTTDEPASRYGSSAGPSRPVEAMPSSVRACVLEAVLGDGEPWSALDDAASAERWTERGASVPARLVAELGADRPTLGASDVPTLPTDSTAVARAIGDALAGSEDGAFECAPAWHERPAETGALARMLQHAVVVAAVERTGRSVLARSLARIVELVGLARPDASPTAPACGALATARGLGIAWVETARGLLVHAVELAAERIARYRIVAPTEWNFHPQGALAAGLAGVPASSGAEAERLARLVVQSLDPCVAARIEVTHA
jgi:hypothetical protein